MITDFGCIKEALKKETDYFDHSFIYEKGTLKEATVRALLSEDFLLREVDFRPTAENFSKHFFDRFKENGFEIKEVTVYETPSNCASYEELRRER